MRLLAASGWAALGIAALSVLIVAAHGASAPQLPSARVGQVATTTPSDSASLAGVNVPGQGAGTEIDPAYFSPGACVAFAPTMGNRHLTVFLDAGHGGLDPGAVGITESG
jgi:N-acetylmuramoyl-L-alanine amidase